MERFPNESWNQFNERLVKESRAQRRLDLLKAREEAERTGKHLFHYEPFRLAYQSVRQHLPDCDEMEAEYYLDYPDVRNLEEFRQALFRTDLYDGGDMHLDSGR